MKNNPWLAALSLITFLIYTLVWDVGLSCLCVYLIFWREISGWWCVPFYILISASYKPRHWRQLWMGKHDAPNDPEEKPETVDPARDGE